MRIVGKLLKQAEFLIEKSVPAAQNITPLPPLPEVSDLYKLYRVKAAKQLSQNFLLNTSTVNRLVSCGKRNLNGYHVLEVGPGPGSITRAILNKGATSLTVVEKDHRLLPLLQYIADVAQNRLKIVHGDILKYDFSEAFPKELGKAWDDGSPPPFFIMGNLPFNISLPFLFKLLDSISQHTDVYQLGRIPLVLTFQHEVGKRFCAEPGDKTYRSRLSITTQYLCDVEECFTISGGSFIPPPKVDVSVMKFVPKQKFDIDLPFYTVDHVVKHIMHFRQKKSKFGLASLFPESRQDLARRMIMISGVDVEPKPWQLNTLHYRDLCYAFEEIAKEFPQLKLVDTYTQKDWLQYFSADGEPLVVSEP